MSGLNLRAYTPTDLPIIVEIANHANKDTYEFLPTTEKSLQTWFQDANPFIVVAEDREIQGFAVATRGWPAEPGNIEISMICLRDGPNATSIEEHLISHCVKLSKADGVTTTLPIGHPKTALYRSWGFQLGSGYLHLTRPLDQLPPSPPIMEGARIRSLAKGEEAEFLQLLNTSYGRQRITEKEFEHWKRDDPQFAYDWVHVIEHKGKLIGAGVSRRETDYNEYYHAKRAYLGPSGTLPEFRGRGLNKAVNWHAMNFAKEQQMEFVSLYTNEQNFAVQKLTNELGYTLVYHWKLLSRKSANSNI